MELPTACDNFVAAARVFASDGSSSGVRGEPVIFAANAADQPADMLKALLSACDEQRTTRAP